MAILKQRLHRKNSSGSYDTIHLETEASLVKTSDGSNVEDSLSKKWPKDITSIDGSTTDLFTLPHGFYFVQSAISTDNNWPYTGDFMGLIEKRGSTDGTGNNYHCVLTLWSEYNSGEEYTNIFAYGSWLGWRKTFTSVNKPSLSDLGAAAASHDHTHLNIESGNEMNLDYGFTRGGEVYFNYRGASAAITDYIFSNGMGTTLATLSELAKMSYGTSDLTAGQSSLATGKIHLVYE